jgi:hypothetical protein
VAANSATTTTLSLARMFGSGSSASFQPVESRTATSTFPAAPLLPLDEQGRAQLRGLLV